MEELILILAELIPVELDAAEFIAALDIRNVRGKNLENGISVQCGNPIIMQLSGIQIPGYRFQTCFTGCIPPCEKSAPIQAYRNLQKSGKIHR